MEEKIRISLISKGEHLVINQLAGKKFISNSKSLFWYVDKSFFGYMIKPGIKTKSKSVGVYEVSARPETSLKDIIESLPGSLNRKWLSQSQIVKVCKHFKKWLKFDGYSYFLCKIKEDQAIDLENPWNNLMVVEIELDYENDLAARLVSVEILNNKALRDRTLRLIIPKRTKELVK